MTRPTPRPRWYDKAFFDPPRKRRKGYRAKGYSDRIWVDEESSATTNTRQRLRSRLRRDLVDAGVQEGVAR